MQRDRDLAHVELLARRANHHLGRELHPDRPQVEDREDVAANRAHPAVRVVDVRAMQDVEEAREDRVADAAQPAASRPARCSPSGCPITSSAPSSSSLDERRDLAEVVGEVGVDHDDVVAPRGREAGEVGAAVAAARLVDDHRAGGAASSPLPSVEPLSTTMTSPARRRSRRGPRAPS